MSKIPSLRFRIFMAAAVGLTLFIFVAYFWINGAILITAPLAKMNVHALPDQSNVVLNDGSSVKYVKGTWEQKRTIQLVGEAYFSVKKGNPFQVETAKGIIEVLGTKFNVRAWGDNLYIECYEGRLKVSTQQQEFSLAVNQSVNIIKGQVEKKQSISHQKPLWSTGSSKFYKENINQVLAELERQYAVVVNAPTMNRLFSGTFRHDDLETALKAICQAMQLRYTIDRTGRRITIEEF